jgi:hypothetical protein
MINVAEKVVEKIKTHFILNKFYLKNRSVYELKRGNMVGLDKPCMAVRHIRLACWIPKATNTHSQYVISIASPRQWWFRERTSILRYTYVACLVCLVLEILKFYAF